MKSLKEIALPITEEEYRNDGKLHYSTLATYERGGFSSLKTLFERKESPSLLFGSIVDTLITGGRQEFESHYMVAEYPDCPDSIINIIKVLFNKFSTTYSHLNDIPDDVIIPLTVEYKYQLNWKDVTRVKVIKEKGANYYRLLYLAKDKTIISTELYNQAINTANALRTSPATRDLFVDNPFDTNIERLYQLKFSGEFNGVEYSIMADEIFVNHKAKWILPIDLKTSSKPEYNFFKSFIEWSYDIQARLYWQVINQNIAKDPYFSEFELLNYHFVVANKDTLTPLVWQYEDTKNIGTLIYGKNKDIICRHPFVIGLELSKYLNENPSVPNGINLDKPNNIVEWINREM